MYRAPNTSAERLTTIARADQRSRTWAQTEVLRIADYKPFQVLDGEGLRCSLYVSYCPFRCLGCYNKAAQKKNYGFAYTAELEERILQDLSQPHVAGLTLVGGEPFLSAKHLLALVRRIRASYYLIGAELGRFGHAHVAMPGGCNFGVRPIDQHIKGFESMGAMVEQSGGYVCADAPKGGLRGGHIYLDIVSVGATMNILLAAVLCSGMTIIENCAKEPHIVDLANFLNAMGAQISGAGTDVIKVRGVRALHGGSYSIIPDQIEAGTYMAAAAAVGGDVLIENVIPKHLDCITAKLREIGADITEYDDAIRVESAYRLHRANVKTMPYPGFPTDMQPQITVCLATAVGTSLVTEGVYDNRFRYTAELGRMGANIQVEGKTAIIDGVQSLHGCEVRACDLRAGAAMVIAAMCAEGTTLIEDAHFIERGYEDIVGKLTALGADIKRVED